MIEHKRAYALTRVLLRLLMPLVVRVRAEGVENIPTTGPVILTPNHIVMMDILAMSVPVPRHVHHMAKVELFRVPVLGGVIRYLGAFPVRRGESDRDALRMAFEVLAAGQVLVVFPEGHRSRTGRLAAGQPGVALIALRSGAPVVPVAISGTEQVLKGWRYGPWAPKVRVAYGTPFTLADDARTRREAVQSGTDTIMRRIAELLPPAYRGIYADPATPSVTAAAEQPGLLADDSLANASETTPPSAS
ncbi:MAG TPA: lysophospholipid acyltransferase family protein [Ktedonobacterales bacterium]|jgi:1-acyl-sn-glycerol-3-phosphate acyltransferase